MAANFHDVLAANPALATEGQIVLITWTISFQGTDDPGDYDSQDVTYITVPGTAHAGEDYTAASSSFHLDIQNHSAATQIIPIMTLPDGETEHDIESFSVVFTQTDTFYFTNPLIIN